jgi:antitoxin YefM
MALMTATFADLRKNLDHYLDGVVDDCDKLIVPRAGSNGVIFISLKEYNALMDRCGRDSGNSEYLTEP